MGNIDKNIISEFNAQRHNPKFLCNAPFCNIHIDFYGKITPCCFSYGAEDYYQDKTLHNIWNGNVYKNVRKKIRRKELPESCLLCENNLRHKEYASSKILEYEGLKTSRIFFKPIRKGLHFFIICDIINIRSTIIKQKE